jgi:hypothetical protein
MNNNVIINATIFNDEFCSLKFENASYLAEKPSSLKSLTFVSNEFIDIFIESNLFYIVNNLLLLVYSHSYNDCLHC